MLRLALSLLLLSVYALAQDDPSVPVVIRLEPLPTRPRFLEPVAAPKAVQPPPVVNNPVIPQAPKPAISNVPARPPPQVYPPTPPAAQQPVLFPGAAPPGTNQNFAPRPTATVPPPPPATIPPDVQNQLIKFFGLDTFGIPGLTGSHPNGFAGAVQELRAAGVPLQGLPEQTPSAHTSNDVLAQANPAFQDPLSQVANEVKNPGPYRGGSASVPLPSDKPGEDGLIGLLANSVRKVIKETGVSDALSNSLPSLFSTGKGSSSAAETANSEDEPVRNSESRRRAPSSFKSESEHGVSGNEAVNPAEKDLVAESNDAASESEAASQMRPSRIHGSEIRRKPSAIERTISGLASALGGGGKNSPTHAGLPRIPGIPLLPQGIPRNSRGQIDVVNLIGAVTRRVSNGTTIADVIPAEQLQTLADNVTDALLPDTPKVDLTRFMGRWFEGINSPRASEQRCVVHHYGGLTKNDKTATFTALKIFREGSEFGPVRYSIGYAFRGGNKDAMLQLHSSETSDAQPFWIYRLGPEGKDPFGNSQYEYAVVSNWVKYPVTVLVRDPDTFKAKYQKEVLRWLEDQGFINGFIRAFNLLQPAGYSNCQYADNTFEVFGK